VTVATGATVADAATVATGTGDGRAIVGIGTGDGRVIVATGTGDGRAIVGIGTGDGRAIVATGTGDGRAIVGIGTGDGGGANVGIGTRVGSNAVLVTGTGVGRGATVAIGTGEGTATVATRTGEGSGAAVAVAIGDGARVEVGLTVAVGLVASDSFISRIRSTSDCEQAENARINIRMVDASRSRTIMSPASRTARTRSSPVANSSNCADVWRPLPKWQSVSIISVSSCVPHTARTASMASCRVGLRCRYAVP